jgi:HAD superfamily hydrolase (TIGR01509 family)
MIIFDCDGVLVDSEPVEYAVDIEVLTAHGYVPPVEVERRFIGVSRRDSYRIVFAEMGRPMPDGVLEQAEAMLHARYRTALSVLPGLRAALDCLRDVPKCVASSSTPASLALKLEVVGLTADFAPHIFSTALVARGKPAPDIYLHAAAAMGCAPPDCIVVEDARHGVTGAKAAGMRVIGFTGASHATPALADELKAAGADSVVASMDALADTVRALLR